MLYKLAFTYIVIIVIAFSCEFATIPKSKFEYKSVNEKKFVAIKKGIHIHQLPDANSPTIAHLPYKTEVFLIEISPQRESYDGLSGYWYKVKFGKNNGYVFGGFLTSEQPSKPGNNGGLKSYFYQTFKQESELEYFEVSGTDNQSNKEVRIEKPEIKLLSSGKTYISKQKFERGFELREEWSIDRRLIIGIFPKMDIQEVFLLTKTIYPDFIFSSDFCKFPLKNLNFPKENKHFDAGKNCIITQKVFFNNDEVVKIIFSYKNLGERNLKIVKKDDWVEVINELIY